MDNTSLLRIDYNAYAFFFSPQRRRSNKFSRAYIHCGDVLSPASRRIDTAVLSYFIYEGTGTSYIQRLIIITHKYQHV